MSRLGLVSLLVATVGACDPATLRHTPDAAKMIDAAPDAVNHGMVTVKVFDMNGNGTIIVGTPVIFIEADGTVAARPVTDTNGIATADVHPGASATAIITNPNGGAQMMTDVGIQPGDNITLGISKQFSSNMDGTFTISWNAYSGATGYYVIGPCSYYSTTATTYAYTIYDYCKQASMDILIIPYNASNMPLAYLEKAGVAYAAGGSTFVSGTYQFPSAFSANYTNVDAAITSVSMYRYAPVQGYSVFASGAPTNGMLALSAQVPIAQTSSVQTQVAKGMQRGLVAQNLPGNALTYNLDLGGTLLPWLGPITTDFANHKLMIPVDTTGTTSDAPDLFYTNLGWSHANGSAGSLSYRWVIIGPTPGDITLPALPADLGELLPHMGDPIQTVFAISIESSTLTWDMVRLSPLDTLQSFQPNDTSTRTRESLYQQRGGQG